MADYAKRRLEKKGIRVLTSTKLEGITGSQKAEGVKTDKGFLPAELVILSIGIPSEYRLLPGGRSGDV